MLQPYSELDIAKYDVVHSHKRGAATLGPLIGRSAQVLSNKVNPAMNTHHLTVDEAVAVQAITKDYRILIAEAHALGHVCLPIPTADFANASDTELLTLWAGWQLEIAETTRAISSALADGRIEAKEVAVIRRELHEDLAKGFALLQRLDAIAEQEQ